MRAVGAEQKFFLPVYNYFFADLLATKEPHRVEVALRAAESLIRSQLSDLKEVR